MLDNAISLMLIWICTTELKHILGIELTDVLCSHTELSSWYEMVETFIQIECKPPSPESHFSSQRNHPLWFHSISTKWLLSTETTKYFSEYLMPYMDEFKTASEFLQK